jgi:hypothetical protein
MRRCLTSLLALVILVVGCSETGRSPLQPAPDLPDNALSSTLKLEGVLEFVSLPAPGSVRRVEKRIEAATGGEVELNGFRISIPAGALPADTTISIQLPTDELGARRVMAEFGPHGIQFAQPVTITFPLTGVLVPAGGVEVARWENGAWRSLGGSVSADGGSVSSTTPHFSEYSARGKEMAAGG